MKLLLTALSVLQIVSFAEAQQVDWVSTMSCGWARSTYGNAGLKVGDAYYIASDARCQTFNIQGHTYRFASLAKLNQLGDSVFLKKLDRYGEILALSSTPDHLIKAYAIVENFNPRYERSQVLTLDTNANVLWVDTLDNLFPEVSVPTKSIMGRDSSNIVVGFLRTSGTMSFWFQRIPYGGVPTGMGQVYNPGHPNCVAYNVEQLPNGNYLISGIVGSRIASYEVDSLGQNGVYHEWWQHPNFVNMDKATVTRIGKNRRLVKGSIASGGSYLGIYEASGTKIWGHIEPGNSFAGYANQDSAFVLYHKINPTPQSIDFFVRKYRFDSTMIWSLQLDSYFGNNVIGGFTLNDMVYNFDSTESALLVGSNYTLGGEPMTCLKISGIGIPATGLEEVQRAKENRVKLFPNPTEGLVEIRSVAAERISTIRIWNAMGKELGLSNPTSDNQLDLSTFPSGIYLIKIDFPSGRSENHRILLRH